MMPLNWVIVLALSFCSAGFGAGWYTGRAPLHTQIAEQKAVRATEQFRVAERHAQVLQDAQDRGDALSGKLLQTESQVNQLKRDRRDAVKQVTTGRPCLYGPALRLLNSAPGLSVAAVPAPAGGAAAEGAAVATDTDIAGWAIDAGAQYEVCRTRLDALIDFVIPPNATRTAP